MKNILTIFCLGLIAVLYARRENNRMKQFQPNKVIAHRGAWKHNSLPQNSIASLQHAIELGCAGSEFDVHITADDSLVINHDAAYGGKTIEQTTYAQLAAVKLANGETIPTLREYLLAGLRQRGTKLVLEIKPTAIAKQRAQVTAVKAVQLVRQLKAQDWIIYISFDYDVLKKVLQEDGTAETQYLNGDKTPEQLQADGIKGLDYHFSVFQQHPEWIDAAKTAKLVLNAWTVNDTTTMDWLLSKNFDAITTNEPELLFERIRNR